VAQGAQQGGAKPFKLYIYTITNINNNTLLNNLNISARK
jgi:hypothetical protein